MWRKKFKTLPRIHKNKTRNLKVCYRDNRKASKLGVFKMKQRMWNIIFHGKIKGIPQLYAC